jgi:hypothetical protein
VEVAVIRSLLFVAYLVFGVIVANSHGYFAHVTDASAVLSAGLAVLLWPVVLLGGNLHLGKLPKVKIKTNHKHKH